MKKHPKKIKNKIIRHILRKIALHENCPPEYRVNRTKQITNLIGMLLGVLTTMTILFSIMIYFC